MTSLAFTIDTLNALPLPPRGVKRYQDRQNPCLSVYVTSTGVRTFFVRKRIRGRDHRLRIGRFPTVTIAQARSQATLLAAQIEMGNDPVEQKRKEREENLTLEAISAVYIERYAKQRNKQWQKRQKEIEQYLRPLLKKRLADITRSDVERLQSQIGQRAPILSNRILALLRAIFNYAIKRGWEGKNPAKGFERYKETSRDRFVLPEEMPFLMQALKQESCTLMRDFFQMLLLTGCRKTNVQEMRWDQIDFEFRQWRIPDTKNGQPQLVPLIDPAMEILNRRRKATKSMWVFPQKRNPSRPLNAPQKAWDRVRAAATLLLWSQKPHLRTLIDQERWKAPEQSADALAHQVKQTARDSGLHLPCGLLDVRMHDLRRTFGSYQAMSGASLQVIGKSLGHRSLAATQIYARLNLDPVRASIEKAVGLMSGVR